MRFELIRETMRWAIASLAIGGPVFLFCTRTVNREIERSPIKRSSAVRRWLTYLTLAIAAAVLIGDATTLVYNLLAGELAARFLLKALTIAGIAGGVFFHYLRDLRRDETHGES